MICLRVPDTASNQRPNQASEARSSAQLHAGVEGGQQGTRNVVEPNEYFA